MENAYLGVASISMGGRDGGPAGPADQPAVIITQNWIHCPAYWYRMIQRLELPMLIPNSSLHFAWCRERSVINMENSSPRWSIPMKAFHPNVLAPITVHYALHLIDQKQNRAT